MKPIAEAEKELKIGFEQKLQAGKHGEWTIGDVSLFLNVCGMQNLVTHQRQKKINGEGLVAAMNDVTRVMQIKDKLAEKTMKFYFKVLKSGKMGNEQELSQSVVWRHRKVEETLVLLKEWDIALDEELMRKKGISICELLFFMSKDFEKELGMDRTQALGMVRRLEKEKKEFEEILQL